MVVSGSDGGQSFRSFAHEKIVKVCDFWKSYTSTNHCDMNSATCDTWLFPLLQMGRFDIHDDESVTEKLFQQSDSYDRILLASGYFNLTSRYMNVVLKESKAEFEILTAAPEVCKLLIETFVSLSEAQKIRHEMIPSYPYLFIFFCPSVISFCERVEVANFGDNFSLFI